MHDLSAAAFFDLDNWRHRDLFSAVEGVWAQSRRSSFDLRRRLAFVEISSAMHPGVHLLGDRISIGEGCRIEPGAVIIGPAIIGDGVHIRTGAYVRQNVILGDGSVVGAHSEAKGVILFPGAKAPHQAYVGDAILGRRVNLGAGTIVSNVKNIGSEVTFSFKGEIVRTGLKKFGAVLGDGCKTGCNSVLNPGVLLGPGSVTYPNATLRSGFYPAGTLIKVRQTQQIVEMKKLRR